MILSAREITLILQALQDKYGRGYSDDKEVGSLQAKLSIMGQMATEREAHSHEQ